MEKLFFLHILIECRRLQQKWKISRLAAGISSIPTRQKPNHIRKQWKKPEVCSIVIYFYQLLKSRDLKKKKKTRWGCNLLKARPRPLTKKVTFKVINKLVISCQKSKFNLDFSSSECSLRLNGRLTTQKWPHFHWVVFWTGFFFIDTAFQLFTHFLTVGGNNVNMHPAFSREAPQRLFIIC